MKKYKPLRPIISYPVLLVSMLLIWGALFVQIKTLEKQQEALLEVMQAEIQADKALHKNLYQRAFDHTVKEKNQPHL